MEKTATRAPAKPVPAPMTPSGFNVMAVSEISTRLNTILADAFALYFKTKNFHWHMSGTHFRDYHLLLDEQSVQILAATDPMAERVRKIGGTTLRSMAHATRLQRSANSEDADLQPSDMLVELLRDNRRFSANLREVHAVCDEQGDVATASLIENWIDEAEGRAWFLAETIKG